MFLIGRTVIPFRSASRRSTRKIDKPSVFFFTSGSGVVRASSSIRSECCTREIQTFCPLTM